MDRETELRIRRSVARWCREQATGPRPHSRSKDYWKGYRAALDAVAFQQEVAAAQLLDPPERDQPFDFIDGVKLVAGLFTTAVDLAKAQSRTPDRDRQ